MANHPILPILHAVHHRRTVLVAEARQPPGDRLVPLGRTVLQSSHRVIQLPLQEALERVVQRRHEDRLLQLANDLVENVRRLVLHGERNGVKLRQPDQNPGHVLVPQWFGSLEVAEALRGQILLQDKLLALGALRRDDRGVVRERAGRFEAAGLLELLERWQHDVEDVLFALKVRRAVVETAPQLARRGHLGDDADRLWQGGDGTVGR